MAASNAAPSLSRSTSNSSVSVFIIARAYDMAPTASSARTLSDCLVLLSTNPHISYPGTK